MPPLRAGLSAPADRTARLSARQRGQRRAVGFVRRSQAQLDVLFTLLQVAEGSYRANIAEERRLPPPGRSGLSVVRRVPGVRALTESAPARLLDRQAVVPGGLRDVGEGEVPLRVRDILDLIEAGERILHVGGVGEGLLALLGEGEGAVRQPVPVARVQFAVRGVWLPGRSGRHWFLTLCCRESIHMCG